MFRKTLILIICAIIVSCAGQKNPLENDKNDELLFKENIISNIDLEYDILPDSIYDLPSDGKFDDVSHLDNLLDVDQIINLTKDELRILRNTIFARYGYKFVSEDLRNHFSRFSWYNGIKNNVENELTEIDWKNIRLIERAERNLPIIGTQTIEVKRPVLVGKTDLPDSRYDWLMKSNFNGEEVIYISPSHFFDTTEMKTINYYSPKPEHWYVFRPPYSNNEMPISGHDMKLHVYNIITHEYYFLPESNYHVLITDSDRAHLTDQVNTPEYIIAIQSHFRMSYIGKNHVPIDGEWGTDGVEVVKPILLAESRNTVFDNPFFMETFDNLISSMNIITKFELRLSKYREEYYNNLGFEYLISRLNLYFDINLNRYFPKEFYKINIYDNGFFMYDEEKLIILDILNTSITQYNYRDRIELNFNRSDFILSDNGLYAFLITRNWSNISHQYEDKTIYKFKLE